MTVDEAEVEKTVVRQVAKNDDVWTAGRALRLVVAVVALTICSLRIWIQAGDAFPALRDIFAPVVDIQTVTSALVFALVALLAWKAPHRIRPIAFTVVSAVGVIVGSVLWIGGMSTHEAWLIVLGVCFVDSLGVWSVLLTGLTMCALGGRRDLVVAAVLGEVLGAALRIVVPSLSLPVAVLTISALTLALVGVSAIFGVPFLMDALSRRSIASLATTNPESFLTPRHRLVVLVAFFEFMHGVVLAEGTTIFTLATRTSSWLLILVGGAWVLARRRQGTEDALLNMAAILMVLGFAIRPLSPGEAIASEAIAIAGASFSWMLLWSSMAAVGMGYPAAALWTFGLCYTMEALAMGGGSLAVEVAGALPLASDHVFNVMNALVIAAFLAYLLTGMRGFSFSEVFRCVRPVVELETMTERRGATIARNCPLVAARCGLTEREAEVLALLARGCSGPEIQERLVISQNTAKTHVRHIYRKLGVHSQRELIALVEGAGDRP